MGNSPGTVDIVTGDDFVISNPVITNYYKNGYLTKTTIAPNTYRLTLTYDPSDTRNTLESLEWGTWTYVANVTIDGESASFTFLKRVGIGYTYCAS